MLFPYQVEAEQGQKEIYGYKHKKIDKNGTVTYRKLQIRSEQYKLLFYILKILDIALISRNTERPVANL